MAKGKFGNRRPIDLAPLQPWEYAALRPHLARHWQVLCDLLWETGVRIGEALRITRDDLQGGMVAIHREKRRDGLVESLPISPSLQLALEAMMRGQRRRHVFARGNHETPYTHQAVNLALQRVALLAHVRPTVHVHLFRHAFGERADAAGMSTAMVARMLGHTSEQHVARYRRPSLERMQGEMRKLQGGST